MLSTTQRACRAEHELLPNPKRTDKRDELPGRLWDQVLRPYMSKHSIPRYMNKQFQAKYKFGYHGSAVSKFLKLYREKLWNHKRRASNRNRNHVMHLLKRFPDMDMAVVTQQYPDVDVEKVKQHKRAQGHFVPK